MPRLFFSAAPTDRSTALLLQRALSELLPGQRLEFWDHHAPVPTEYRTRAQTFLESARALVVVHSEDFATHADPRWELAAALAEKKRRPGAFDVVVVQARRWVVPPELRGFPLWPSANETLEGQDAQVVRTAQLLANLLLENPSGTANPTPENKVLPLTLPDLRERLLELTDRYNLSDAFLALKAILDDAVLLRRVLQLQDEFAYVDLRERQQLVDYQEKVAEVKANVELLVADIAHENQLRSGWRPIFLDVYRSSEIHETTAFFFPSDDIKVPDLGNLPGESDNSDRTGLLNQEQQMEFLRLLLLCQDALNVDKFAAAHAHCEQVRTRIDPRSAQLYEYLLLSFIKKEGAPNIIRRYLEGYPSGFRHVKLYSDRFNLYQTHQPPYCPSETGEQNRQVAVEELIAALHALYSHLPGSAVLDTGDRSATSENSRAEVRKCLDAALTLYYALTPTKLYLETLVLELAGAGKCWWLERMSVHDGAYELVGNADFDLPGKVYELLDLLAKADPRRPSWKQREMLRENLFWLLLQACELLAAQVREETRLHHTQTDLRRSVIRIVESAVLGHVLLTAPGDELEEEKSLLRLAVELLLPGLLSETSRYHLPAELALPWFTLNAAGEVVPDPQCADYQFDVLVILEKIVADLGSYQGWLTVRSNIKEEVWQQYNVRTDADYEVVRAGLQWTDFRRMHDLDARQRVVGCLRRWRVAYQAYPERGVPFLEKMLRELTGDELLLWFEMGDAGLVDHPLSRQYRYAAQTELQQLLALPGTWSEERTTQHVIGNLYRRSLLPTYDAVSHRTEGGRTTVAEVMRAVLLAFQRHPVPLYLDLVYRELTEEVKYKWLEINARGQLVSIYPPFDAVGVINQLTRLLPERYPPLDTRRKLADLRWREQTDRYYAELSETRHENRLPERRIAVDVIRRLKGVFLYYPDLKYLELVRRELYDLGRIRWYERSLGIFKFKNADNHFENAFVPFDYKAERVELALYERDVTVLFQQMLAEAI